MKNTQMSNSFKYRSIKLHSQLQNKKSRINAEKDEGEEGIDTRDHLKVEAMKHVTNSKKQGSKVSPMSPWASSVINQRIIHS